MIGLGQIGVDFNLYTNVFCSPLGVDSKTWGLSYRGEMKHNSQCVYINGCTFTRGSIIGCLLDMWHGKLYFTVDGKLYRSACFEYV